MENKHPIPEEEDVATLSEQKLEDEITKTSTTKNPKAMHKSIYKHLPNSGNPCTMVVTRTDLDVQRQTPTQILTPRASVTSRGYSVYLKTRVDKLPMR